MSNYQIDHIDQKILSFLVKNTRMPFLEIARECNVSGAAIHQRVKRLETNGVITGSRLLVKPQALGLNVCAFVSVSLSEANKYPDVIESFKKISEIVECHSPQHDPEDPLRAADRNPDFSRPGDRTSGMGKGIPEHQLLRKRKEKKGKEREGKRRKGRLTHAHYCLGKDKVILSSYLDIEPLPHCVGEAFSILLHH